MWNRISLSTGRFVKAGFDRFKSVEISREVEAELGLKSPVPKRERRRKEAIIRSGRLPKMGGRYETLYRAPTFPVGRILRAELAQNLEKSDQQFPLSNEKVFVETSDQNNCSGASWTLSAEQQSAELIAWAWENGRADILRMFGICLPPSYEF